MEKIIILEGGPAGIAETARIRSADPSTEKIKLLHCGGYEHFERVDDRDGDTSAGAALYRWTMRTEIAE
jgi:hypothetical protein